MERREQVRRPDRLAISVTGDDGSTRLFYDGQMVALVGVEADTVPVPNTIQGMLETVMGKLGVDFPLADFLTNAPDKSFLSGVTSSREINTVTIDGVPCRHLLFTQPPGIELELWIERNEGLAAPPDRHLYGGAAYRGPMGSTAVRGPSGAAAVRGPGGATAYRPPAGGTYYDAGGARPYYPGAAVATGVAVGAAASAYRPPAYYAPPVVVAPSPCGYYPTPCY